MCKRAKPGRMLAPYVVYSKRKRTSPTSEEDAAGASVSGRSVSEAEGYAAMYTAVSSMTDSELSRHGTKYGLKSVESLGRNQYIAQICRIMAAATGSR